MEKINSNLLLSKKEEERKEMNTYFLTLIADCYRKNAPNELNMFVSECYYDANQIEKDIMKVYPTYKPFSYINFNVGNCLDKLMYMFRFVNYQNYQNETRN